MYTLTQLELKARNILNEDITTKRFFTDGQIEGWINDAIEEVWKTIRASKGDFFVKHMSSTDAAYTTSNPLLDRAYDPVTLKITANQTVYPLPPDFIALKYIQPISGEYINVKFNHIDRGASIFDYLATGNIASATDFVFDIIGTDLVIAPTPASTFDIKIGYSYRQGRLRQVEGLTADTVTIAAGSTTATSANAEFSRVKTGQRIIIGSTINVDRLYPYIESISNPTLVLSTEYSKDVQTAQSYLIEDSLPVVMMDYTPHIVDYAVMRARQRDKDSASIKESYELFQFGEKKTGTSSSKRQLGADMVEPYLDS